MRVSRLLAAALAGAFLAALPAVAARAAAHAAAWPGGVAVVGYETPRALTAALARHPARILRRIPSLRVAEVEPRGSVGAFAAALGRERGIAYVDARAERARQAEPALRVTSSAGASEWQFAATRSDAVPQSVARAASAITIAIVDTGADLTAPDIAAKAPAVHSVLGGDPADVVDENGHGTFVAALAAGSVVNGDGVAGFGGDAHLLVVRASGADGSFSDVDEAAAIAYAVDNGARIVNLSLGGPDTSRTERNAIDYAVAKGALLVAAAGNGSASGSPIEYPAALLQPIGSNGQGGIGLAVAASTRSGARASFSNSGSYISLAAPGEDVFSAVSSASSPDEYPRVPLAGATGLYGFGSGTSFAAPQVAGAAALVWAANPGLSVADVVRILKQTASGGGSWNPEIGYGVIDVAAAVAAAGGPPPLQAEVELTGRRQGTRVELAWHGQGVEAYRLSVSRDSGPPRVVVPQTTSTSASYALAPGHSYSFRVAAVAADGSERATSQPFEVGLVRTSARLLLGAAHAAGSQYSFTARLRLADPQAGAKARQLVLESFDGARWRRAGVAATGRDGSATWLFRLSSGKYRVRVRLLDAPDLAAAPSPVVSLTL